MQHTKLLLLLSLTLAGLLTGESYAKPPLSAGNLAGQIGLEVTDVLVIGSVENVRRGIIPLANTMPEVFGILTLPKNIPESYPPARRRLLYTEEFDSALFHLQTKTPHLGAEIYEHLIEQGAADRYKAYSSELQVVWQGQILEDDNTKSTSKLSPNRKGGTGRPALRTKDNHSPKSPSWGGKKSKNKREYF